MTFLIGFVVMILFLGLLIGLAVSIVKYEILQYMFFAFCFISAIICGSYAAGQVLKEILYSAGVYLW